MGFHDRYGSGMGLDAGRTLLTLIVCASLAAVPAAAAPTAGAGGGTDRIDVGCTAVFPADGTQATCTNVTSRESEPNFSTIALIHGLAGEVTVEVSWFNGGSLYHRLRCTHLAGSSTPFFHRHVSPRPPAPKEHDEGSPFREIPTTCSVSGNGEWSSGTQTIRVDTEIPVPQACVGVFDDCAVHGGFKMD